VRHVASGDRAPVVESGAMDLTQRIAPDMAEAFAAMAYPPPSTVEDIAAIRAAHGLFAPDLTDAVARVDHLVPGEPPVAVRVHRPVVLESPLPCVLSIHGGGYIGGSYDDDDFLHDRWCPVLGYVGVAVEYRLAPEWPYPAPLDDCLVALRWVHDHAQELGVDPTRVGVRGASAGGGLAAALALRARDEGVPVAFQQLIYPMLDDREINVTSVWEDPVWRPVSNRLGWSCYLGERSGTDDVPAYAAPARATDLSGLPPTFICVGALDVFCDEDIDYARRLNHAGVDVELHVYPGAPHGFDFLGGPADVARRCRREQRDWLRARLGGSPASR
jgi:acetyl esterase/lipase